MEVVLKMKNMDKTKLSKHLAGEIVAHLLEELIVQKLQLLQTHADPVNHDSSL